MVKKVDLNMPAYWIHNNGDRAPIHILNYDHKGNAWVKWDSDGFVNLMPVNRIELRGKDEDEADEV